MWCYNWKSRTAHTSSYVPTAACCIQLTIQQTNHLINNQPTINRPAVLMRNFFTWYHKELRERGYCPGNWKW